MSKLKGLVKNDDDGDLKFIQSSIFLMLRPCAQISIQLFHLKLPYHEIDSFRSTITKGSLKRFLKNFFCDNHHHHLSEADGS